jgi:hypothetical protein
MTLKSAELWAAVASAVVLMLATPAGAQPELPTDGPWADAHLETGDWTYVGWGGDTALFYRPAPDRRGGRNPRLWVRMDFNVPDDGARSTVELIEFDCTGRQNRTLDLTAYPENNLRGRPLYHQTDPGHWQQAVNGTVLSPARDAACGGDTTAPPATSAPTAPT